MPTAATRPYARERAELNIGPKNGKDIEIGDQLQRKRLRYETKTKHDQTEDDTIRYHQVLRPKCQLIEQLIYTLSRIFTG
jgi:hypothetical protein